MRVLECHSRGERRYSALYARLQALGNQTIEAVYQGRKRDAQGQPYARPKGQTPHAMWFRGELLVGPEARHGL